LSKKDKSQKLNPEDVKSVVQVLGRMEKIIQTYEHQMAQTGMDFMILQEYSLSLGGTQEGYLELHKKRMSEAQEAAHQQLQETVQKHKDSGIVDLEGKPLVVDTTPPKDMAPPPGDSIILEKGKK